MVNLRKSKTVLKFDKPASWWGALWREGLPMGNGVIGASLLGGAANDTIMLTHAALKWQGNISVLPDISDKLKDIRKLLDDGKYKQAEELYPNALIAKNYRPITAVPLPLCDIKINMPVEKPVKDYMRVLNLDNGEASVVYKDGNTKYDRSMFVSRENDYFILEINKSGSGTIDAEFSFDLHDKNCNRTPINLSKLPDGVMTKYESHFMYFSARNENGTEFGAVARLSYYGGTQEVKTNSIRIKGASNVLLMVKVFIESQREKEWKSAKAELAANKLNYDKMLKTHTSIHSKLLNAADLDLNAEQREQSIDLLLHDSYTGSLSPVLMEKLWYFGRYLFVSSTTNNGNIIASPYGLWCGDYKAPLSIPNLSGETQLLYSHAFEGGLAEQVLPLINYYESVIPDLKKNALRLYNCKGIFVPSITSPGTGLLGSVEAKDIYFIAGAGMLASIFYDYYCYTGDKKFLKDRAMPFMREAANFYEDFLKIGDDGLYYTSPSYSPSSTPGNLYNEENGATIDIAKSSEVDFAVLRQLFANLIDGAEASGIYKDEIAKWQDMLTKIPKAKISSATFVHEYNSTEFSTNFKEGAAAQLYAVYPSDEVSSCGSLDFKKAYQNTVKKRLTEGLSTLTSYNLAYLANVSAKLNDADATFDTIEHIIKSTTMANLVTAANDWRGMGLTNDEIWSSYQLQANCGIASAITSMFVQSCYKGLNILPALPSQLKSGSINNISTRCGCDVSVNWDLKKGNLAFTVKAKKATTIFIKIPNNAKRIAKGPITTFGDDFIIQDVKLLAGKPVTFDVKI